MASRVESLATLESLGVADIFAHSYRSKKLPFSLDIYFGPPEEFFIASDTQETYTEGRLVPLLDDGNFGSVIFFDPETGAFLKKYVESLGEPPIVFTSWQQYLADLVIRIAESGVDDAELEQIATAIDFLHLDRTLAFMNAADDDDWSERRYAFLASI